MSYENREGSGVLFSNTRKTKPNQPDWKGEVKINGVDMELVAWIKKGKNGYDFLSVSCKPKGQYQSPEKPKQAESQELPF